MLAPPLGSSRWLAGRGKAHLHPFEETVSIVGPVVGAIILLTLFFKFVGWASRRSSSGTTAFIVKGVFDGDTPAIVHLSTGAALEDVRMLGFTEPPAGKAPFPYELSHMAILQHPDGCHTLVPAKLIRRIEVPRRND
jgi:hypothetical protein